MADRHPYIQALLNRLRELRVESGSSPEEIESKLILGPGWIERFESGDTVPQLDLLLSILHSIGKGLPDLIPAECVPGRLDQFERHVYAEQAGNDLRIHFRYAKYDATYLLPRATLDEFDGVLKTLRDGLARLVAPAGTNGEAIKSDAVARAYLHAVTTWPHANPSDLWWFLVYRVYCDPFNHPARFARLNFTESWKRTGGWALEEVLVRHYSSFLQKHGIRMFIASREVKERLIGELNVVDRLEADKADVLLMGKEGSHERLFGVVHVKASFAERRTDDVPMSHALVRAGYCSPLWTMDCKSSPAARPINRGELGPALTTGSDRRSAKRKDIEEDAYFSACFSYNRRTVPTPDEQTANARIYVCDFTNPDDIFSRFIIDFWKGFRSR